MRQRNTAGTRLSSAAQAHSVFEKKEHETRRKWGKNKYKFCLWMRETWCATTPGAKLQQSASEHQPRDPGSDTTRLQSSTAAPPKHPFTSSTCLAPLGPVLTNPPRSQLWKGVPSVEAGAQGRAVLFVRVLCVQEQPAATPGAGGVTWWWELGARIRRVALPRKYLGDNSGATFFKTLISNANFIMSGTKLCKNISHSNPGLIPPVWPSFVITSLCDLALMPCIVTHKIISPLCLSLILLDFLLVSMLL